MPATERLSLALGDACGWLVEQEQSRPRRNLGRQIANPPQARRKFDGERIGPGLQTERLQ